MQSIGRKRNFFRLLQLLSLSLLVNCTNKDSIGTYLSDEQSLKEGEQLFAMNCSGCHSFAGDGIGPNLSGVTARREQRWIDEFVYDPSNFIAKKDANAIALVSQYKTVMPSFSHLDQKTRQKILAYINQHRDTAQIVVARAGYLTDPIKEKITYSNIAVELKPVAQVPPSNPTGLLTRITKLFDRGDHLYVNDLRGKLYAIDQGKAKLYFDIAKAKPQFIHEPGLATGFGSFAFHPNFKETGLLYTTHCEPAGAGRADFGYSDTIAVKLQWVLTEWKTSDPMASVFSGTPRELMRLNVVTGIHGVQEITFNPLSKPNDEDYGLLYIGIGDAGSAENGHPELLLSDHVYLGTIFRIDPSGNDSKNGKYGIPATNPFGKDPGGRFCPEVYAHGFRNPHRITWLTTGEMIACNIGQMNIESLYKINAGNDQGWPLREGSFLLEWPGDINKVYPLPPTDTSNHYNYPIVQYDHDEGNSISGGYEYTGKSVPSLLGKFVFGDIVKGRIFLAEVSKMRLAQPQSISELRLTYDGKPITLLERLSLTRADLRLGRDQRGELYVLTKPDGMIYKIMPTSQRGF